MSTVVRRRLFTALLAVAVPLAAPAVASAAQILFGSDLPAPADTVESHGANTIHWNSAVSSTRPGPPGEALDPNDTVRRRTVAGAPAEGQLRYVTIWGGVSPGGAPVRFHFVVLRPRGGAVKLDQIERSQLHRLPVS